MNANPALILDLADDVVTSGKLPPDLLGALQGQDGPTKVRAQVRVLMFRAVELGLDPLTGLSGLRLRSDGSLHIDTGHLAALLRREGGRYSYDVVERGPTKVVLQFMECDPESGRGFLVRCMEKDRRCLPHRRKKRAAACRECGSANVWQTETPAGWRWLGDVTATVERAKAEGAAIESQPWRMFPEGCLMARALREGARRFAPDVAPRGFGERDEDETEESARALQEAEKPARQPKSSDESVTLAFIEQDIRARSVTRGPPLVDDTIEWREDRGPLHIGGQVHEVRRARWADASWVAWRLSHNASRMAGGEDRYKALDSWPAMPTDDAPTARELVRAALPEQSPVGADEPRTEVLPRPDPAPLDPAPADMTPDEREAFVERKLAEQRAKPESVALRESVARATRITDGDLRTVVGSPSTASSPPTPSKIDSSVAPTGETKATPPDGAVPSGAPTPVEPDPAFASRAAMVAADIPHADAPSTAPAVPEAGARLATGESASAPPTAADPDTCPACWGTLAPDRTCKNPECAARPKPAATPAAPQPSRPLAAFDPVQDRKDRASEWSFRPLVGRPKVAAGACIECTQPIAADQPRRLGVPHDGSDRRRTKRGALMGATHETCRLQLAEGVDPRAAPAAKAAS